MHVRMVGACKDVLSKITKVATRLIMAAPYREHTDQLFKKLLILQLATIYECAVILF